MSGQYKQHYNAFKQNPAEFWLAQSKCIPWYKTPQNAYTQDSDDLYHWFDDGQLNTSYLALDQHVEAGFGEGKNSNDWGDHFEGIPKIHRKR